MEMTLLFLFFGVFWAHKVDTGSLEVSGPSEPSFSFVSTASEALNLNSVTSNPTTIRFPEKNDSAGHQISLPPSSAPSEVSSPETSITANVGLPITDLMPAHEVSTGKSSVVQEISNATSHPTVLAINTLGLHAVAGETMATSSLKTFNGTSEPPVTMATSSLETSNGTSGTPVTMATSSLETSNGTSGTPVTVATSSLETSNGTSGTPVTVATSSLETSNGTSGTPVTVATSSLETSNGTSGTPVTMATSSLETSNGTSGTPVTMATSSLDTAKGISGSPISGVKISIMTTPEIFTNTVSGPSDQKRKNTLMMAVLVALLMVTVLLVLLLLWRQRQKRRTGALTLSRGGKRNGAVDAWAGPAPVSEEEAVIATAGVSGGDKASGTPEGEGSSRRPTLTTFLGRRKSRQASLALEELKAGSAPGLKGEEEPLVGSEDGAVEAPASDVEVGP